MQTTAADPVDTRRCDFLSFAPPFGEKRVGMEELRVSVEPEIRDRLAEEISPARPGFPLRPGKVQRPVLPDETLRRDRLFDWLEAPASRRVFYVIAEAGFGKTTLVADFLRRSRLRTFWYRLDEEDTDGLVFIRYLVAACQAVDTSHTTPHPGLWKSHIFLIFCVTPLPKGALEKSRFLVFLSPPLGMFFISRPGQLSRRGLLAPCVARKFYFYFL